MKRYRAILLLIILSIGIAACRAPIRMEKDPFFESFYEKARLIMTEEEMEIYVRFRKR
jgi:hypothetical protein